MTFPEETSDKTEVLTAEVPEAPPEAAEVPEAAAEAKKNPKVKKVSKLRRRKHKILARSAENDIRYRGPLSYRHFRVLAWVWIEGGYQASQLFAPVLPENFGDMIKLLITGLTGLP